MRICIDCRMITGRPHGIAVYLLNLLRQLAVMDRENRYVLLTGGGVPGGELPGGELPLGEHWAAEPLAVPLYGLREQAAVPLVLRRLAPDLFHSPTYSAPVWQPCPTVMTIHDVIPLLMPRAFSPLHRIYYRAIVGPAARRAVGVFTVSEASKRDLIRYLGVAPGRVRVTPNGVSPNYRPLGNPAEIRRTLDRFGIGGHFLLWVGNRKPHKNAVVALRVLARLRRRGHGGLSLVLVGMSRDQVPWREGGLSPSVDVLCIPQAEEGEMVLLYNGATLFLFPSLAEGFGLPVLEALACGAPVLAADIPAVAEVAGDAALLRDPRDEETWTEAAALLLEDAGLRAELRERGLARARGYSWAETARQTLKGYQEVAGGGT